MVTSTHGQCRSSRRRTGHLARYSYTILHQTFAQFPRDETYEVRSRVTNAAIVTGTYVCKSGFTSATRCGVIDIIGVNNGNNSNLVGMRACGQGGDTGGSVYDYDANRAYGLHVGSSDSGTCGPAEISYFSPIQSIERATYVTVETASSE